MFNFHKIQPIFIYSDLFCHVELVIVIVDKACKWSMGDLFLFTLIKLILNWDEPYILNEYRGLTFALKQ